MAKSNIGNFIYGTFAVIFVYMVGSGDVSGSECGHLCDPRWMSEASVSDVRAEVDARHEVVNTHKQGVFPLHAAAIANPDPRVAALLLERGANLEERTPYGATPLHLAAGGHGKPQILLTSGFLRKWVGEVGLDRALEKIVLLERSFNYSRGNPIIVDFLLGIGAIVSARDIDQETPLHYASSVTKFPQIIEMLLRYEAKVNAINKQGQSPLHFAALFNPEKKISELLLEYGANPNLHNLVKSGTPLHLAALNWNEAVMTLLLNWGGRIEERNGRKKSPLQIAAENFNPKVSRILLKRGADLESKDDRGRTALQHAVARNKNPAVALLLIENGADIHVKDNFGNTVKNILQSNSRMGKGYFGKGKYEGMLKRLRNILQQ